jgi:DNA-binding MarR family transcriptional regulator
MREWRKELHSGLPDGLSINQFRVLFFVGVGHGSSSYLARQLGVTPAAMSKMVDVLVQAKLLSRDPSETDRRQVVLKLTRSGQSIVKRIRAEVEKRMQTHLNDLSQREQKQVSDALALLQKVFSLTRENGL